MGDRLEADTASEDAFSKTWEQIWCLGNKTQDISPLVALGIQATFCLSNTDFSSGWSPLPLPSALFWFHWYRTCMENGSTWCLLGSSSDWQWCVHFHGSHLISHRNTINDSSRSWVHGSQQHGGQTLPIRSLDYPFYTRTFYTLHNIIQLCIQLWIAPVSSLFWELHQLWHKDHTLPHRTYWLRSCFTWMCDGDRAPQPLVGMPGNSPQLTLFFTDQQLHPLFPITFYLHSFLQLMSFWFSFPLFSFLLNTPNSTMKELDHT